MFGSDYLGNTYFGQGSGQVATKSIVLSATQTQTAFLTAQIIIPASMPVFGYTPFTPEPSTDQTLAALVAAVLARLGDPESVIWPVEEVTLHLRNGYQQIANDQRMFWDWAYLENLPRGFSYTADWETQYLDQIAGGFNYGQATYTGQDEFGMLGDERRQVGFANHTSPFEATEGWLSVVHASVTISATADVPKSLTSLERVTWDKRGIDGMAPRLMQRVDARYELTRGEVYGFMWAKDGIRTLRKVRVPSAQADTVTVTGSWGAMRRVADLTGDTVTGTWGIPRRIASHHPMGTERFGAPRRPFLEGKNVRVEHHRQGRPLVTGEDICELPGRYAIYLRDYAQARLLERKGPGQDMTLAQHYDLRWQRALSRIAARIDRVQHERIVILGGDGQSLTTRPPRPKLPWAYGTVVN